MKEAIRLEIPQACGEDWRQMERREEGRHCQHCSKTVVDFTGMTDGEVFRYLDRIVTTGICGRLLPEQLGRDLRPAPMQRNGWSGWKWVLASMLMLVRPADGGKQSNHPIGKPTRMVHKALQQATQERSMLSKKVTIVSSDCRQHVEKMRKIPRFARGFNLKPASLNADSVKPMEAAVGHGMSAGVLSGQMFTTVCFTGAISVGRSIRVDTSNILTKVISDTVSALNIFKRDEFVTVYPNPVSRGSAINLAWLSGEGKYQIVLVNMRGQIEEQRVAEIGAYGQVDRWPLSSTLAAGVYVLRIVKDGGVRADTRKIVVY